jgi:hypothetical protein
MACYGDRFSILYVADVCTSLEAHAFTTCYGDSFTLLQYEDCIREVFCARRVMNLKISES